jgi:DNA topoisomerase-1
MNLIIVESPTKARTLSRFLGRDFDVEATMGHIKDLPKSKLGVEIENDFKPDYRVVKGKSESIKKIKSASKKAEGIYLATDPDREGEAIAQHVKEILSDDKSNGKKELKRIVFHEITEGAVDEAIKNPRGINDTLVDAQVARRVLDRLVGYKLSPLLWKKVRRGLSAGRVQSVALRLIVEREEEIKAFKPQEYWEIYCRLKAEKTESSKTDKFKVKLVKIDGKKAEVENEKDAKQIVKDLEKSNYLVSGVKKKEVKKRPYPPFTTSTLTQTSSRYFRWSAKRTMSIAQRLYEEGLITYHRTDSTNIAKSAVAQARDYIAKKYSEKYVPEKWRFYKTKSKSAQEAHEAIRPTNVGDIEKRYSKLGKDLQKLYGLIWRRFVACQMKDALYDRTTIEVEAPAKGKADRKYLLRATGQIMKFDGWRVLFDSDDSKTKDSDADNLPDVKEGDGLKLLKVLPEQKFTQPPPRYGEASLIKTLEKLGIGRPSTYAPIISTIQARNYVEKQKGKFHPTSIGNAVNGFLVKNFPGVFDYSFTAGMEDELDKVAEGKFDWVEMMKKFYTPFEERLKEAEEKSKRVKIETEKLGKKCPKCKKGELVVRLGRFGKFVSCSRFPDCDHKESYTEKVGMKCPGCGKGDVVIKYTRKRRRFYGCSRYSKCEWASWRKPSK